MNENGYGHDFCAHENDHVRGRGHDHRREYLSHGYVLTVLKLRVVRYCLSLN